MSQNFTPRLKRLEAYFSEIARRSTELRVAGMSRMEFYAETLAMAFCALESSMPGFAAGFVEAVISVEEDQAPADESANESADDMLYKLAKMICFVEEQNPGMVQRVLDAILSGAEAITEETLFPDGRPLREETWGSRHGKRFYYRLDSTG